MSVPVTGFSGSLVAAFAAMEDLYCFSADEYVLDAPWSARPALSRFLNAMAQAALLKPGNREFEEHVRRAVTEVARAEVEFNEIMERRQRGELPLSFVRGGPRPSTLQPAGLAEVVLFALARPEHLRVSPGDLLGNEEGEAKSASHAPTKSNSHG